MRRFQTDAVGRRTARRDERRAKEAKDDQRDRCNAQRDQHDAVAAARFRDAEVGERAVRRNPGCDEPAVRKERLWLWEPNVLSSQTADPPLSGISASCLAPEPQL